MDITYLDLSKAFCKDFDVTLGDKTENCGLDSNQVRWISRHSTGEPAVGEATRELMQSWTVFIEAQSPEEGR